MPQTKLFLIRSKTDEQMYELITERTTGTYPNNLWAVLHQDFIWELAHGNGKLLDQLKDAEDSVFLKWTLTVELEQLSLLE